MTIQRQRPRPKRRDDETAARQRVLEWIERESLAEIVLQFSDVVGMVKTVTIPAKTLPEVLADGKWFDGSAVEGFARESETDMYLRPDLRTLAVWPDRQRRTARLICDVMLPDGSPFAGDPRHVLRRALRVAAERGYGYTVGCELEFYLWDATLPAPPPDGEGYFGAPYGRAALARQEVVEILRRMGIPTLATHTEVASSQHELSLAASDALAAADSIITARIVLRLVARGHGLEVSLLPKPFPDRAGSGLHLHQHLVDLDSGQQLFADLADAYGLSGLAQSFMAGQLAHARGLSAVLAPLVNSYKRLVPRSEAPIWATWARRKRAAYLRVPEPRKGDPADVRIEMRAADPACNPYLGLAVLLMTGLDGIDDELPLPPPFEERPGRLSRRELDEREVVALPTSLGEALEECQWDPVVRDTLGPLAYESLLAAREREWDTYRQTITDWEWERYQELF